MKPQSMGVNANSKQTTKPKGEKMKKTLLSVIAGLAVIGSACAAPSLSDRKALCEKHPDKYVWVEKTQACVRIDPCSAGDYTYCISAWQVNKPENSYARLLIERFVKNVMYTNITELKYLGDSKYAFKTGDLDYRVIEFGNNDDDRGLGAACWAYGKEIEIKYEIENYSESMVQVTGYDKSIRCKNVTRSECEDIGDFLRLLKAEGMPITSWGADRNNRDYFYTRYKDLGDIVEEAKAAEEDDVASYFVDGDCHLM